VTSIRINTLMDRLRIQSILQRLIRTQGREQALSTVMAAIDLEFPDQINIRNETHSTRNTTSTRTQHHTRNHNI